MLFFAVHRSLLLLCRQLMLVLWLLSVPGLHLACLHLLLVFIPYASCQRLWPSISSSLSSRLELLAYRSLILRGSRFRHHLCRLIDAWSCKDEGLSRHSLRLKLLLLLLLLRLLVDLDRPVRLAEHIGLVGELVGRAVFSF